MINLTIKAQNYATDKTNEMIKELIAQAYTDGYIDGFKDCEDNIPVDLLNNKMDYVDLGLPSGTLWSTDYEKNNDGIIYLSYREVSRFSLIIPTIEQWTELQKTCKWEIETENGLKSDKTIKKVFCVGPNGNKLKFDVTGMFEIRDILNKENVYFWLKDNGDTDMKPGACIHRWIAKTQEINGVRMEYYDNYFTHSSFFCGYKLPVRLIKKK